MPRRRAGQAVPDTLAAADAWFLSHGLTYFVPEVGTAVRGGLRPRRVVPLALVVAVLGAGGGALLAWLTDQVSAAPAVLVSLGLIAAAGYAATVLQARPIVAWALGRSLGSLRSLLPLMTRALPLLLVFVTFLFINAEVWQLSASLSTGTLWLTVLLFVGLALGFLLVRLPEEVDLVDDAVDAAFLRRTCHGTPLSEACEDVLADPDVDPVELATVSGLERTNLVIVLVVIQFVQIILLAGTVFGFFLLFGALVMDLGVQSAWTTKPASEIYAVPYLSTISVPLFQVSLFLAAFSSLYLTVSTLTDDTYREHFFASMLVELEQAVGMRAVYLAVRAQRRDG